MPDSNRGNGGFSSNCSDGFAESVGERLRDNSQHVRNIAQSEIRKSLCTSNGASADWIYQFFFPKR